MKPIQVSLYKASMRIGIESEIRKVSPKLKAELVAYTKYMMYSTLLQKNVDLHLPSAL